MGTRFNEKFNFCKLISCPIVVGILPENPESSPEFIDKSSSVKAVKLPICEGIATSWFIFKFKLLSLANFTTSGERFFNNFGKDRI